MRLAPVPFLLALIAILGVMSCRSVVAAPPHFAWIESENPTATIPVGLKFSTNGRGNVDVLSGKAWLSYQLESQAVDAAFAGDEDGPVFTYDANVARTGHYAVWNRIGFELIRSPIAWSIDNSTWVRINADAPTIDVADLQDWSPLGWLNMGSIPLSAGHHVLKIRVLKSKDAKGVRADLHYASDAIVLTDGPFHPNGLLKPDQIDGVTDADHAAAKANFMIAAPDSNGTQTSTELTGDWQITADDEPTVVDRLAPIPAVPDFSAYLWRAIAVPGDRNAKRPEMAYVHRYWLRTVIGVPVSAAGHSIYLHLPAINMAATVFLNGRQLGFTKNNFAAWDCDLTKAVQPGGYNYLSIGIKDSFYGSAEPAWAAHIPYLPFSFWHYNTGTYLDMPVLYHFENGILRTPTVVVAGAAYVSDVFAQPSVEKKALGLDITLRNPSRTPRRVVIANRVEPLDGGATEKTFVPQTVTVPAGEEAVAKLSEPWPKPRLWWPDDPHQYVVVTTVSENDRIIDQRRTKFGFREWQIRGRDFTLNGIPWHGFEDATDLGRGDDFLMQYHDHHQTMHRMWGEPADIDAQLDFMDANGVNVRRSGILDGEGASGLYDVTNTALWVNWREQLAAWIKGQRNHPSIFMWSIENEITFINGHVTGHDAVTTAEHHKSAAVVAAVDPTRPFMTDGGNALLDESLPVYGGHYLDPPLTALPEGAFADRAGIAHRQVWPITQDKPVLLGETYYAPGIDLADLATVGGDAAFVGRAEARPATARIAQMLSDGYRWNGINFDLYFSTAGWPASEKTYYQSWGPAAAICPEPDWTFDSGAHVTRTVGVFNDSRSTAPITLSATLSVGGRVVSREATEHRIAPGHNEKFRVAITLPRVRTGRVAGHWTLALTADGKSLFTRRYDLAVLGDGAPSSPVTRTVANRANSGSGIAVFDPAGAALAALRARGISATALSSLDHIPTSARILLVGADALSTAQSGSSALAAYAAAGHVVIVLEQNSPLRYQALPGAMESTDDSGSLAFIEAADHPIFAGLRSEDFVGWSAGSPLYRDAYRKPTSGGQSLVQCASGLQDTALAQMPIGSGLMIVTQLRIESSLATSAVARHLLVNMVRFARTYRPVERPVAAVAPVGSPLLHAMDAAGVLYAAAGDADPIAALAKPGGIAVVSATPSHLAALAAARARVDAFTAGGGWLVLNGLTPDGLAAYNRLVGIDHMIRPFHQEKVQFATPRDPLAAGLSTANIAMGSGKRIFDWEAGEYPDPEAFGYVVDTDDVAPFGTSTFGSYANIINNFTMADGYWPLIINFPMDRDGKPYSIPIQLPKPRTLTRFTYVQDLNYAATNRISLVFGPNDRQEFTLQTNGEPQTFEINPPRAVSAVSLEIDDWTHDPAKQHDGQDLIGIDNIYLFARHPADYTTRVRPLLNIGALVAYPRGAGGIMLCNVHFKETESVPANAAKKQSILATLLRNLDAPFSGKSIIAGAANLAYTPIDISSRANQFIGEQGWFGDRLHTFADLPTGNQRLAGVPYSIYTFSTSPVPTAVMLGGRDIPGNLPESVAGIPIHRKADALFFLQTARMDQPRSADDIRNARRFEIADYRVHYADGTTATIPIYQDIGVANYIQSTPAALPDAQIAWTRPFDGETKGNAAAAYSMQWNNPSPEKVIDSVDLVYGPDRRGVPALLAITAAVVR